MFTVNRQFHSLYLHLQDGNVWRWVNRSDLYNFRETFKVSPKFCRISKVWCAIIHIRVYVQAVLLLLLWT